MKLPRALVSVGPLGWLALAFFLWGAYGAWATKHEQRKTTKAEQQRDSLAADAFTARQVARGWTVHYGVESPEQLDAQLMALDSTYAKDAKASRVHVDALVQLVATLRGHVESRGTVVMDSAGSHPAGSPQSPADTIPAASRPIQALGRVDDGLLSGSWRFQYLDALLSLDYTATPTVQLTLATAGDGRSIVSARGTDPRVTLQVQDLVVDPVRVEIRACTWGERSKWAAGGALGGLLLGR